MMCSFIETSEHSVLFCAYVTFTFLTVRLKFFISMWVSWDGTHDLCTANTMLCQLLPEKYTNNMFFFPYCDHTGHDLLERERYVFKLQDQKPKYILYAGLNWIQFFLTISFLFLCALSNSPSTSGEVNKQTETVFSLFLYLFIFFCLHFFLFHFKGKESA